MVQAGMFVFGGGILLMLLFHFMAVGYRAREKVKKKKLNEMLAIQRGKDLIERFHR